MGSISVNECAVILVGVAITFLKLLTSMMFIKWVKFGYKGFGFVTDLYMTGAAMLEQFH